MILFPTLLRGLRRSFELVKGEWVEGTPVEFSFIGDAQALANKDVVALNFGRHDLGKYRVFSDVELKVCSLDGKAKGDLIILHGKKYEVIQEGEHHHGLLEHFAYYAELRE